MAIKKFQTSEVMVDNKFRLTIPATIVEEAPVENGLAYFKVSRRNHCLVISFEPKKGFAVDSQVKKNKGQFRVMIPPEFRRSASFYYGRSMTLAYHKGQGLIELWPRPKN